MPLSLSSLETRRYNSPKVGFYPSTAWVLLLKAGKCSFKKCLYQLPAPLLTPATFVISTYKTQGWKTGVNASCLGGLCSSIHSIST